MGHNSWDDYEKEGNSEDDFDPQYTMMLENLKEDGKSYALKVANSDGTSEFTKYEEPDEADSECDPRTKRNLMGHNSWEDSEKYKDDSEDDSDPQYKMMLENLREDGKSYVLKVANSDGTFEFIKYEEPDETDGECDPQTKRNLMYFTEKDVLETIISLRNDTAEHKTETKKILSSITEGENVETITDLRNVKEREMIETPKGLRSAVVGDKEKTIKKLRNVTRGKEKKKTRGLTNVKSGDVMETTNYLRNVTEGQKVEIKSDLINISEGKKIETAKDSRNFKEEMRSECESYQFFLDSLKIVDDHKVFVTSGGEMATYGNDNVERYSDKDVLMIENAPDYGEGNFTPFVTSKVYDASCLEKSSKNEHSQFREEVMDILRRPYDQKEFDMLFQEVKERKPVEGRRNLRWRIISFPEDRCGKSYLDHYSDLERELNVAPFGSHKMLNILRGFFYWLKNLSREGAFKPWLDSSCLAVVPTESYLESSDHPIISG